MTFTEIYEKLYGDDGIEFYKQNEFIEQLPTIDKIVYKVYKNLTDRKGFDHWWDDIDDEIKDEIFEELKSIVRKEIK